MKNYLVQDGGRELLHDDLQLLEAEGRAATLALCAAATVAGISSFIVSGCRVTQSGATVRIGSGIVYVGGQLLRLASADGLTLPVEIVAASAPVTSEPRRYEDGSNRPGWGETMAVVQAAGTSFTSKITITSVAAGGLTYAQVMAAAVRPAGLIEWGAFDATLYGLDGKGVGAHRGWALCDGRNGTTDLRGRVAFGYVQPGMDEPNGTANQPEWQTVGGQGGQISVQLTVAHLPPHNHNLNVYRGGGSGNGGNSLRDYSQGAPPSGNTQDTGGGMPHENRPPYTVLIARQWIGF